MRWIDHRVFPVSSSFEYKCKVNPEQTRNHIAFLEVSHRPANASSIRYEHRLAQDLVHDIPKELLVMKRFW